MIQLSVIICTHNPRPDYMHRVLEALRAQTLSKDQWQLLLVDNASDRALAKDWDLSWHPNACHVREEKLGLAHARQRGMREASADLLVFVDDDNVLESNYLAEALRIGQEWPQLGVWGGSIVPEFEVAPPEHLRKYLGVLSLRQISSARWSNVAICSDAQPWGAGLCVRSEIAVAYCRHYRETKIRLTGRSGKDLGSSEDTEICYVACSLGFGMGLFPELRVTHLIPATRLRLPYLLALTQGLGTSNMLLGLKWRGALPDSPFSPVGLMRLCKDVVTKGGLDRKMHLANVRAAIAVRRIARHHGTIPSMEEN
jgi:GT2 family glycosyltransferase